MQLAHMEILFRSLKPLSTVLLDGNLKIALCNINLAINCYRYLQWLMFDD